jgi:hypothetical protein
MNIDELVSRADAKENESNWKQSRQRLGLWQSQHGNRSHVLAPDSLVSFESHYETPRPLPPSKDKKKGSSCVLTLKDIVEVLSRPADYLQSRTHARQQERETPSEKSS